jgi:hypothetical protein
MGDHAQTGHMTGRRGKEEKYLFGSSSKGDSKKPKNVQTGRQASKKKGEEVRTQMQCRRVEGYLGHLLHLLRQCLRTFRNPKSYGCKA